MSHESAAEKRIHSTALGMALAGAIIYGLVVQNWIAVASVLLGAAVSWVNFRWLSASVSAVVLGVRYKKIKYLIAKFLLRLALIFLVLYVMIRVSPAAVLGFIVGLSVYILAIMAEAILSLFSLPKSRCTKKNFS
ncbi:MAG TPA: ATP synthase subunit I [Acidobacteriota bacterium]|jgi:hypothetical protein